MKSKKYLIPTKILDVVEASSVQFVDCNDWAYVEFRRGESVFTLKINMERRECDDVLQIRDEYNESEVCADDVLGFWIDLELLADDLTSEIKDHGLEEY